MIDETAIRAIVVRLARPIASGAHTIDRAALLAEGPDCAEIEAWIVREGGEPYVNAAPPRGRGLHADRENTRSSPAGAVPSRYVLPASALA
ncbi:MAG TPA: hypothetical protein VGO48_13745 [Conexibacter sp.]|jgi:hypothetical protein|nr:hypothetical protein [Conexibacter sp.]